ncbi:hypothetical protein FGG08_006336 [Glutinoglossum americanum]|uniref:Uncharacterized protein n=1 Tax=Glutinoglossum americanum TaxID=1670608 RepID=A0A9P8KV30_9PEZI|nr:hypothetical protein FGG08_006336 [Glutinoglossum americanum]
MPSTSLLHLLLLSLLPSTALALNLTFQVIPLSTQTHIAGVGAWLNLLTLSIAPLATHIVFGLAEPVVLAGRHPRWTDRLPHFNPISIAWRYFAIADRRIRAKCWDRADMAACNAVFWDGERWDGSEAAMIASRRFVAKLPTNTYVSIVSGSSVATLAMALQGVQAIAMIVSGAMADRSPHDNGLAGLFSYLAILGLSRLIPALWISNDYGYTDKGEWSSRRSGGQRGYVPITHDAEGELSKVTRDMVLKRLHPVSNWRGFIYRGFVFWIGAAMVAVSLMSILRGTAWQYPGASDEEKEADSRHTISGVLQLSMYGVLVPSMFLIHARYLASGSTVIPCIQSRWYKLFTGFLILLALAAFVVSAIETRVIPCGPSCGQYTTLPKEFDGCP